MRKILLPLLLLLALLCGLGLYQAYGGERLRFVLRCEACDERVVSSDKDVMAARLERCGARNIDLSMQGDTLVASFRPSRKPRDWKGILASQGRFRIAELVRGRDLPEAVGMIREGIGARADLHPDIPGTDTLFASAMLVPVEHARQAERIVSNIGFVRGLQGRAEPMWGSSPGFWNDNGTPLEGRDLYFVSTSTPPERMVGNDQIQTASFEPAQGKFVDRIHLQLTSEGSSALGRLIDANQRRFLATIVDDRVMSAAMVAGPIPTSTYDLVGCGDLCPALAEILATPPLTGTWQLEEQPRL